MLLHKTAQKLSTFGALKSEKKVNHCIEAIQAKNSSDAVIYVSRDLILICIKNLIPFCGIKNIIYTKIIATGGQLVHIRCVNFVYFNRTLFYLVVCAPKMI